MGLFAALWVAFGGGRRAWRRALAGLGAVVVTQAVLEVSVDALAHHYGFDPHVGLLRGWALALPAGVAWWLFVRPARPCAGRGGGGGPRRAAGRVSRGGRPRPEIAAGAAAARESRKK